MTQGSSSVVVEPQDWGGSVDELARKMMPLTRRPPAQVVPLLARGPMTIEADLSLAEAQRLQERLRALGVPAQIVGPGEEPAVDPKVAAAQVADDAIRADDDAAGPADDIVQVDEALELDGLFEGDELFDVDDFFAKTEAVEETDAVAMDNAFGAEPAPPAPAPAPAPASPREIKPFTPPEAGWDSLGASLNAANEPALAYKPTAAMVSEAPSFDASHMNEALRGEAKPPYAPEGFDDRVEHIPALAALLSGLAPGAGQIYNGQEEQVAGICRRSVLRPWVESVRQARDYGEKVRDDWAPRPEDGALWRALRHLAVCWVVAALLVSGLVWAGGAAYRLAATPEVSTTATVDLSAALQPARARVLSAQAKAQAAQKARAEVDAERARAERFTMSDTERAQRLFRKGYAYCSAGKYRLCAHTMNRVSELSPELRRKAFRLQAWAEIRQSSDSEAPMPDVGPVESLSEFEMKVLSSEVK